MHLAQEIPGKFRGHLLTSETRLYGQPWTITVTLVVPPWGLGGRVILFERLFWEWCMGVSKVSVGWYYCRRRMWHTPPSAYQIALSLFFLAKRVQILISNNVLRKESPSLSLRCTVTWLTQAPESHFFVVSGLWVCMWWGSSQWDSKRQSAGGLLEGFSSLRKGYCHVSMGHFKAVAAILKPLRGNRFPRKPNLSSCLCWEAELSNLSAPFKTSF